MCNSLGIMGETAQAILLISWFRIRRDMSAIVRELRFRHAQYLTSSRAGAGHVAEGAPLSDFPKGISGSAVIQAHGDRCVP